MPLMGWSVRVPPSRSVAPARYRVTIDAYTSVRRGWTRQLFRSLGTRTGAEIINDDWFDASMDMGTDESVELERSAFPAWLRNRRKR